MIVLGYIQAIGYDYRRYDQGRCPDEWRTFADAVYNPRHVPAIPSEVSWVIEKHVMGVVHHRHDYKWADGYHAEVLYVENRKGRAVEIITDVDYELGPFTCSQCLAEWPLDEVFCPGCGVRENFL